MLTEKRRIYNKEWRARNKELMAEKAMTYYEQNKEQRCAYTAQWKKANPQKILEARLLRDYNLSIDKFNTMLEAQGHRCAICEHEFKTMKNTHVDHCHASGVVRGLLCGKCNMGLGLFRDKPEIINNAIAYLSRQWDSNPQSSPSEGEA